MALSIKLYRQEAALNEWANIDEDHHRYLKNISGTSTESEQIKLKRIEKEMGRTNSLSPSHPTVEVKGPRKLSIRFSLNELNEMSDEAVKRMSDYKVEI